MSSYTARIYSPEDNTRWNRLINQSHNGTFLFDRGFMEYHSDRFHDASMTIWKGEELVAAIPGHEHNNAWFSHMGLTYGGIITKERLSLQQLTTIWDAIILLSQKRTYKQLTFKLMPSIYNQAYDSMLEYILWQQGAQLVRRDVNMVINLTKTENIAHSKRIAQRNGLHDSLEIREGDFDTFWSQVLQPVLNERHGVNPVHSIQEIKLLSQRFPQNIKQYCAYKGNELLAGITIFISGKVVKSQYAAVTATGKEYQAMDFLYIILQRTYRNAGFQYFDLGIVNENEGKTINAGLTSYKERLGAYGINQDRYVLAL